MPHITLTPFTASYQYNKTLIRQNNNDHLLLSHRICGSCITQDILTFTLTPPPIDFSYCELDFVVLKIPIQKFFFYHNSLCNKIIVSSNSPSKCLRLEINITPRSFYDGFLHLNITDLFRYWNPNQTAIYTITLCIPYPNLTIQIKNKAVIYPSIDINYHLISQNKFVPDYSENSYIEVCSVSMSNCFIESNGIFLFDSIYSANNIDYSTDTGHFLFFSSGSYYVDWMLYLRGTGSIECIKIGLVNHSTGETFPFNSPCVIPGQICGQHILHVEDSSYQYSLVNSSESTIQLCNNITNASLIIFKL